MFTFDAAVSLAKHCGVLTAHVALSREDARFVSRARTLERVAATRGYVGALLEGEEYVRMVWDLLKEPEEGGFGAAFYVCGSTAFVATVLSALEGVARRFASELEPGRERDSKPPQPTSDNATDAREILFKMIQGIRERLFLAPSAE